MNFDIDFMNFDISRLFSGKYHIYICPLSANKLIFKIKTNEKSILFFTNPCGFSFHIL